METAAPAGPTGPLHNDLARRRQAQGLTQQALAARVGLSRQALHALESGRSAPSVPVALRLAGALGCRVENLFWLEDEPGLLDAEAAGEVAGGARVVVARVGERWVAHALGHAEAGALRVSADGVVAGDSGGAPRTEGDDAAGAEAEARGPRAAGGADDAAGAEAEARGPRAAGGAVAGPGATGRRAVRVELLRAREALGDALLCAGCAPALGLLAARLGSDSPAQRVHWLERSSTAALDLLAAGQVHIAGSHLLDEASGEYNLPELRRRLPRRAFEVFTLARWEVGLVVAPGNPRRLRGVADLPAAAGGVVRREAGSGADRLLSHLLRGAGVTASAAVPFRDPPASGHLDAARRVAEGRADACLAIRSAAVAWGLDFVPLANERFDLVVEAPLAGDARIVRLLDTLAGRAFRRELGSLGGHFTDESAAHVARLEAS